MKWRSHAYAHSPWFNDLIRHPRILDAVEDVIGPDILVWTSTFFIKEPRLADLRRLASGRHVFRPGAEGAGLRLGRADRRQPRGRLHGGAVEPRRAAAAAPRGAGLAHSINRAGQTITEPFDESNPVAMALPAGSFSLHHELAVHRSAPNNAAHRRIGIGLNYIPTHVRVNGPVRLQAMLVRGEDRYGHFDLIEPPSAERDAAALAVHQRVSDRYRANYNVQVTRHEREFAAAAG